MSVPTRVNYDEAIQMSRVRLQVKDPDLKQGDVEVVKHKTKMGIIPSPWGMEGGFAIVYKFRTQSGRLRALRCFKSKMPANIKERYQKIGAYFKANASQITAEFKYHEPGIKVQVGMGSKKSYPLIEMEWVDGVTLLKKVDELKSLY